MLSRLRQWAQRPRNARLIRILLAALIGTCVGLSCRFLPEHFQAGCRLAAQVIKMVGGVR